MNKNLGSEARREFKRMAWRISKMPEWQQRTVMQQLPASVAKEVYRVKGKAA